MAYPAMADERTPLLEPAAAPPTSKTLSEVRSGAAHAPWTRSADMLGQTKVYPLIHLIRVDILAHIGQCRGAALDMGAPQLTLGRHTSNV